jgi:hypothetical protein
MPPLFAQTVNSTRMLFRHFDAFSVHNPTILCLRCSRKPSTLRVCCSDTSMLFLFTTPQVDMRTLYAFLVPTLLCLLCSKIICVGTLYAQTINSTRLLLITRYFYAYACLCCSQPHNYMRRYAVRANHQLDAFVVNNWYFYAYAVHNPTILCLRCSRKPSTLRVCCSRHFDAFSVHNPTVICLRCTRKPSTQQPDNCMFFSVHNPQLCVGTLYAQTINSTRLWLTTDTSTPTLFTTQQYYASAVRDSMFRKSL